MGYLKLALISAAILLSLPRLGAETKQKLTIKEATVFLSGAELVSTANLSLHEGENEIMFTNVAGNINHQSLVIHATNGVIVESATPMNNYLTPDAVSPRIKEMKDSLQLLNINRATANNSLEVINEYINIIQTNRKVSGDNTGLSVAELTKMLDLVSTRLEGYINKKSALVLQIAHIDDKMQKLNVQINEELRNEVVPGGQLLVKFYSKEATNSAINISYVSPNAGWEPTYDIFADVVNAPIRLVYKANVHQNSGVAWNNVHITLSTGNPIEGVQAPVLTPWYLGFYHPVAYNTNQNNSNKPTPFTQADIARLPTTTVNDIASQAATTYQAQRGNTLSLGGGRGEGTLYIIDGVTVAGNGGNFLYEATTTNQSQSTVNSYVAVDNTGVNTSFDIDLPYTIPSDGQPHLVSIKSYNVPATYRYYAVPKLDKDAFLQARITNWEDLNLLPGTTNIFYEGTYVGQGNIDVRNIKDTMNISMGRDKKIMVKRERDTKLRSVQNIGSNVRETYAYTITARNNRKESINIVILDHQPVSNDSKLEIEDKKTGTSTYDEKTGMMEWNLTLKANETINENFGFTIKYPKTRTLTNQN